MGEKLSRAENIVFPQVEDILLLTNNPFAFITTSIIVIEDVISTYHANKNRVSPS